jgi:hypothetical protein
LSASTEGSMLVTQRTQNPAVDTDGDPDPEEP